jgi:hypothetical protein
MKQKLFEIISSIFPVPACLLIILAAFTISTAQSTSAYNLAAELNAAAAEGDVRTAKRVLNEGLDVNYKRSDQTALHFAISFKRAEMVKFLLANGADPSIANGEGLNALQLAQKGGNTEIVQIIRQSMNSDRFIASGKNENQAIQPRQQNDASVSSLKSGEQFGRFKAGDTVLHSRDRGKTWERGTVLKTDAELQKYLVENEAKTVQNYYDSVYITTLERQSYWTNFFVGDWNLTLPMTSTERVSGNDAYLVFAGGNRLPPLRINSDGNYIWVIDKGNVIRGRWQPNENGPGLILLKGDRGDDWILYNTSDAAERENFKTDTVRLVSKSGSYTPKHGFQIQKK